MLYVIVYALGGALIGYLAPQFTRVNVDFPINIALGAVGGVIGGLVFSLLSTVLGIILSLVGVAVGAYVALLVWNMYVSPGESSDSSETSEPQD